jgi:glycosyltransferase involved in cell wall biosynthesis
LLFPIDWPEPFGLVMIEAMACGTPVLAFDRGSVSEIVEDGKTGIVVQSKDEAIRKLPHLLTLDRRRIRHEFERRFSAQRMAQDHIGLYQELLKGEREQPLQSAFQSDALVDVEQADQSRSTIQ